MKTLFIECNMGLAGDMLTAALIDLFDNKEDILKELNSFGLKDVETSIIKDKKCGIEGIHVSVKYHGQEESEDMHNHEHEHEHEHHHEHDHEHHHHHHSSLEDIKEIINGLNVSDKVKKDSINVYELLAEAEAHVHGSTINDIHFHEVGTMDAIADIVNVSYLLDKLNVEKIIVSPIHVGRGFVKCAHGILPVPAPATEYLLHNIPYYSKDIIEGELCTPTGAALAKYYADEFSYMPTLNIEKSGYGLGTKDFKIANVVRVFLGQDENKQVKVIELDTNVDDMTGEEIAFATERLIKAGAYEVFTTNINMKKNRPGILLSVICSEEIEQEIVKEIFANTSTIGIRKTVKDRFVLDRQIEEKDTNMGKVRIKKSSGYGVEKEKIENDDMVELANKNDKTLLEIKRSIKL